MGEQGLLESQGYQRWSETSMGDKLSSPVK